MGRRKSEKTANWTSSGDLQIMRMTENNLEKAIKNKKNGIYYCITENNKYRVMDNRTKMEIKEFNNANDVIDYYNKKEGFV